MFDTHTGMTSKHNQKGGNQFYICIALALAEYRPLKYDISDGHLTLPGCIGLASSFLGILSLYDIR
jgi:hypothetical protein